MVSKFCITLKQNVPGSDMAYSVQFRGILYILAGTSSKELINKIVTNIRYMFYDRILVIIAELNNI